MSKVYDADTNIIDEKKAAQTYGTLQDNSENKSVSFQFKKPQK
jgi:hypothetical protein